MEENWSNPVFFSMISDSRFDKDIKQKIKELHRKVMSKLKNKNKFKVEHSDYRYLTFTDSEGNDQYRVHYKVQINKKNTKLTHLYGLVNSVVPVYYGTRWGD